MLDKTRTSRRSFLKSAAVAAGAVGILGSPSGIVRTVQVEILDLLHQGDRHQAEHEMQELLGEEEDHN